MKEIEIIFTHNDGKLGIDENSNLYWNGKRVITEQKVILERWVNIAIICASASTVGMLILSLLEYLCY